MVEILPENKSHSQVYFACETFLDSIWANASRKTPATACSKAAAGAREGVGWCGCGSSRDFSREPSACFCGRALDGKLVPPGSFRSGLALAGLCRRRERLW